MDIHEDEERMARALATIMPPAGSAERVIAGAGKRARAVRRRRQGAAAAGTLVAIVAAGGIAVSMPGASHTDVVAPAAAPSGRPTAGRSTAGTATAPRTPAPMVACGTEAAVNPARTLYCFQEPGGIPTWLSTSADPTALEDGSGYVHGVLKPGADIPNILVDPRRMPGALRRTAAMGGDPQAPAVGFVWDDGEHRKGPAPEILWSESYWSADALRRRKSGEDPEFEAPVELTAARWTAGVDPIALARTRAMTFLPPAGAVGTSTEVPWNGRDRATSVLYRIGYPDGSVGYSGLLRFGDITVGVGVTGFDEATATSLALAYGNAAAAQVTAQGQQ